MSTAIDIHYRYDLIIGLIPIYPFYVTTQHIMTHLKNNGCFITQRSLQRNLSNELSRYYPIFCNDAIRPYQWSRLH